MTDFENKEIRALEVIAKKIIALDKHLTEIEETDSKVKHFIAQEEAIHDIRSITRHIAKMGKIADKELKDGAQKIAEVTAGEADTIKQIDQEFDKLETTLGKLSDDDNKVKSFLEQKKAIYEIKKILKKENQLDDIGDAPQA